MPFLRDDDPRAPKNRAHLLYLSLEKAGCVGKVLDRSVWNRILTITVDAYTPETRKRLTRTMRDLGMIANHAEQGRSGPVEVLPDGLRFL